MWHYGTTQNQHHNGDNKMVHACGLNSLAVYINVKTHDMWERIVLIRSDIWTENMHFLRFQDIRERVALQSLECTKMYKFEKRTCEKLNFQIWSSCASPRGSQSSLVKWWVCHILNFNAIFGACLLWVVAQMAKPSWFSRGGILMGKKGCLLENLLKLGILAI